MQQMGFLRTYSDQQIGAEIEAIRQGRFINGYPAVQKAAELAERIERTELAGGSSEIRAKGLAWCARLLCQPETLDRARELVEKSKAFAETGEARLAEAFIVAAQDKDAALALLAPINYARGAIRGAAHRHQQRASGGSNRVGRKSRPDARFIRFRGQILSHHERAGCGKMAGSGGSRVASYRRGYDGDPCPSSRRRNGLPDAGRAGRASLDSPIADSIRRSLRFRSPPIQRPSRSAGGRSRHSKRCPPSR